MLKEPSSFVNLFLANPKNPMYRFIFFLFFFSLFSHAGTNQPRVLTLTDAILLAVRENPNVQQAQMSHVIQKYALELAQWQFKPHYSFSAKQTTTRNYSLTAEGFVTENVTGAEMSASILTPIGTKVSLTPSVNQTHHFHPGVSFEVMQPLLRGFGKPIVEAALYQAMDNEKISRLNVEGALRGAITAVINGYLDQVAARKTLEVDEQALQRAEISLKQTNLFIKAGRKARVELVAVEAEIENARANIENDKNNLAQTRLALLSAIGLDPETPVTFENIDIDALIKKYPIPSLEESKKMILENDIQYQVDNITLEGTRKRGLLEAIDKTRWELNLTANASTGGGIGGGPNAGLNSLVNSVNQTSNIVLNLTIPIDDMDAKVGLQTVKISLRQAELALQQSKWLKETNAINAWNSVFSVERSLLHAKKAEELQQKTYQISFKKYSHGLIDSLQLQLAMQQLISNGQTYNLTQINYLKSLVNLDEMLGRTLETWHVNVR